MRKLGEWGSGLLMVVGVAMLGLSGHLATAQTVINYPSGFSTSGGQIWLENNARLSGSEIHLVPGTVHNASNAWYETPQEIQAFTTTFTFHISCSASPSDCGDGFGFEIICACTAGNPTYNPATGHPGFTYSGYSGGQFSWSQCGPPFVPASQYCVGGDLTQLPDNVLVKFDMYNNVTGAPGAEFTGYYTNGAYPQAPYNPQYDMSGSGINLQSGDEFTATLIYNGSTLVETLTDTVTEATYTQTYTGVNIPAAITANTGFIGFGGGSGAALEDVYLDSWTYTVNSTTAPVTVATPTFSPAAGTYTSAQTVTISDTTSGATIYYTSNGTAPTTSSTVYTGPITVSSAETMEAMAVASGDSNSRVASAAYTINLVGVGSPMTCLPLQSVPGQPGTLQTACTITLTQ